jgi:hypothetical protein
VVVVIWLLRLAFLGQRIAIGAEQRGALLLRDGDLRVAGALGPLKVTRLIFVAKQTAFAPGLDVGARRGQVLGTA